MGRDASRHKRRSPSTTKHVIENLGRHRINLVGRDNVTASGNLFACMAEKSRGEYDPGRLLDQRRCRAAVDVRRVLVDINSECDELPTLIVDKGAE